MAASARLGSPSTGYATGHFGKWHVGTVKAGSPLNPGAMGFDEWLSHDNFFELHPTLSRNGGPSRAGAAATPPREMKASRTGCLSCWRQGVAE